VAVLRVERRAGRNIVSRVVSRAPIGLRVLDAHGPCCRVAIVSTAAMLLSGDDVALEIDVGPGASCEILEISATVAHPATAAITQRVAIRVHDGGFLALRELPLILAAATDIRRATVVELFGDARVCHREVLVFGRHGERPGVATVRLRVERDGMALFDDTLNTCDPAVAGSPAVLSDARALGTLGLWGLDANLAGPGVFGLGPRDHLVRILGRRAGDVIGALEAFERRAA
jgi:urease accessory protein